MLKMKTSNVRNFISYNICPWNAKTLYSVRYFLIAFVCIIMFLFIFYRDDIAMVCQEARGRTRTDDFFMIVTIIYSLAVLFVPMIYRRKGEYSEFEELIIYTCLFSAIVLPYGIIIGLFGIYMIYGVRIMIIALFLTLFLNVLVFFGSKHLIIRFIRDDAFNEEKYSIIFSIFDGCIYRLLGTQWSAAICSGIAIFGRTPGVVTIMALYIALDSCLLMCPFVCGYMQIKYAREYDLQAYLPTKTIGEMEKEEEQEEKEKRKTQNDPSKETAKNTVERENNACSDNETTQEIGSISNKYNFGRKWGK